MYEGEVFQNTTKKEKYFMIEMAGIGGEKVE